MLGTVLETEPGIGLDCIADLDWASGMQRSSVPVPEAQLHLLPGIVPHLAPLSALEPFNVHYFS